MSTDGNRLKDVGKTLSYACVNDVTVVTGMIHVRAPTSLHTHNLEWKQQLIVGKRKLHYN
jgi:hypothetical protein